MTLHALHPRRRRLIPSSGAWLILTTIALIPATWPATAPAQITATNRQLQVNQSYGTHVIGDLDGNRLMDVVFLTQLGEGDEEGVLSLFMQERRREFGALRRFKAPPGARDMHITDVDADGSQDLMIVHRDGIARMRVIDGELRRDIDTIPVRWPDAATAPILLRAVWVERDGGGAGGAPPLLLLPSIGVVGVFEWRDGGYDHLATVRTTSSAFNYSATMGVIAARVSSYRRDVGSLGDAIESRSIIMVLPTMYVVDMDNDGDSDLVICRPSRAIVQVFDNPGDFRFAADPTHEIDLSSVTQEEALAGWVGEEISVLDLNADDIPDFFITKRGDAQSREVVRRFVHMARAANDYAKEPDASFATESFAAQSLIHDFNRDGLLDLGFPIARLNIGSLLTTGLTGSFKYVLRFHLQRGGGGEPFAVRPDSSMNFNADLASLRETNGPYYTFDYDLSGDGLDDFAIVNDTQNLDLYKATPEGDFGARPWARVVIDRGSVSSFADIDNDGVPDFLNLKQNQTSREFTLHIDFLDRR
jgi:hypothetical protein